jgi:hypothetical protein
VKHLAALLDRHEDLQVTAAAAAVADLLGVGTSLLRIPPGSAADRSRGVLDALADERVAGAALRADQSDPLCWDVVSHAPCPVVVVPPDSRRTVRHVSRVLLPLDGSPDTAEAVADIARQALAGGAQVLAMHVFDAATVPAFWDHPAHTHEQWTHEFLRRNLPGADVLDLRRGDPAAEVLAATGRTDADLVLIGWGRDLSSGRAATVRQVLADGVVPVLLVATGPAPRPAPDPGPRPRQEGPLVPPPTTQAGPA